MVERKGWAVRESSDLDLLAVPAKLACDASKIEQTTSGDAFHGEMHSESGMFRKWVSK